MSNDDTDDGPDDGPDDTGSPDASAAPGEAGKRRRRRRRRRDGASGEPRPEGAPAASAAPSPEGQRERRQWQARDAAPTTNTPDAGAAAAPVDAPASSEAASAPAREDRPRGRRERGRRDDAPRGDAPRADGNRTDVPRGEGHRGDGNRTDAPRGEGNRGDGRRGDRSRGEGRRGDGNRAEGRRGDEGRRGERADRGAPAAPAAPAADSRSYSAPTPRLEARGRAPAANDDDLETTQDVPLVAWGTDDGAPAPAVTLAADLPVDTAPDDDVDPLTHPLITLGTARLGDDIVSVVGVRFVVGGRIQWCDAGDADYTPGDRVLVDSDRGPRLATIATKPLRRGTRDRSIRRVIRRANEGDLRGELEGDADRAKALRIAKDVAAGLRMPMKVFRVEGTSGRGGKLNVYYTTDERLDLREFLRELSNATGARIELRQLGVRDEAKAVGGIGSCGLTLCCTTWLPDFVPVSIKMAKDQGLVLSPTKVSGQCGRLKCCLVYEQAGYAELRKGLPKLGKRVVSPRGEGRVVEVDVLRQRVRVSYGMGDTEVLPATEVKPLFPPGTQPPAGERAGGERGERNERGPRGDRGDRGARDGRGPREDRRGPAPGRDASPADDERLDPAAADIAAMDARLAAHDADADPDDDAGPTDDPSSAHFAGDDDTDDPSSDHFRGTQGPAALDRAAPRSGAQVDDDGDDDR